MDERCGISGAGYTSSPFSVLQSDTDLRNKIMPATNKTAIMPTPALMFPVICDTRLTIVVPINDAPFPQMSISPKYSPDFSAGMIFVKYERDNA